MDESLGMRRGPEREMKESYASRRHESEGMRHEMKEDRRMERREESRERSGMGRDFNLKDNEQAWMVKPIPTDSENYDLSRIKPYNDGSKGYPAEAWNYRY